MTLLILFLIAICSFTFYGVVGEDKTWLLAPLFMLNYGLVAFALWRKALGIRQEALGNVQRASGVRRQASGMLQTARDEGLGDRPASHIPLPTAGSLFLLFLLYGIAMIPQATVPFESKLVMLFIGGVVGAYLVWGAELTAFKDNRLLLGFLIFVVMLAALYGLIVHFKYPEKILWTERYAMYEGRLMSTYICPNHFAHLMQMLMPFCVALLFIPQAGLLVRALSVYSFLVFLPPLFLTESRAGWLGAIAAVGVVVCLMALRRSKKLFIFLVIFVPLLATLLLFAGWKYSETFQRRAKPVVEFLKHQSDEGVGAEAKDFRPQTWMDTIDMIKEAPLLGFGPGNYRYTYPEHRKRFKGTQIVTGHPHNEYLELIADFGLIGFVLFALAWCYGLMRILIASLKAEETRHAFIGFAFLGTAAGTMVHSFFDFQMHVYPNALVFALLAAIAVGPLAAKRAKGVGRRAAGGIRGGENRGRRTEDGRTAVGRKPLTPPSTTNNDQPATSPPTSNGQRSTFYVRRAAAWLLAVGYLLLTVLCLQTMSSAFLRALGDKRLEALGTRHVALGDGNPAAKLYELSSAIDPLNWRACKGMGDLLSNQRYFSLDVDEKIRLAEEESDWYASAYRQNSKDPAICAAFGKGQIFLGKNQGTGHWSSGNGTARGQTAEDGGWRTEVSDQASDAANLKQATSNLAASAQCLTPAELIETGLELLREACAYRPFNDVYWWNLGVELRKLGRYEEALEVFKYAQSVKRTPSTAANIKWIEKQMSEVGGPGTEDGGPGTEGGSQGTEGREWIILDPEDATADPDLVELLERMGE